MVDNHYLHALMCIPMEAIRELQRVKDKLESQLRVIQSEIDAINKSIKVLERDNPEEAVKGRELRGLGITDAIRLSIRSELITPLKVRDQLLQAGFSFPKGKLKLLNTVFSTMKRLAKTPEFEAGKVDGKFAVRRKA